MGSTDFLIYKPHPHRHPPPPVPRPVEAEPRTLRFVISSTDEDTGTERRVCGAATAAGKFDWFAHRLFGEPKAPEHGR